MTQRVEIDERHLTVLLPLTVDPPFTNDAIVVTGLANRLMIAEALVRVAIAVVEKVDEDLAVMLTGMATVIQLKVQGEVP